MNLRNTFLSLLVLSSTILGACTGGYVYRNGTPVIGANVTISTCDGRTFNTITDSLSGYEGGFAFNPYDPHSADFDSDQAIPEERILVHIEDPEADVDPKEYYAYRTNLYTEYCSVPYDNSWQDLPCKSYTFDFRNASDTVNNLAINQFNTYCSLSVCERQCDIRVQKDIWERCRSGYCRYDEVRRLYESLYATCVRNRCN